jgi:predicted nucleic acid-binding protein
VSIGLTLDTGALIALERRRARVMRLVRAATERRQPTTVPVVALTEWWRGRTDVRDAIRRAVRIEAMDEGLAELAGEALAAVRGATAIDAIVMASAARRGDLVLTSNPGDLVRLASYFGGVRVLAV